MIKINTWLLRGGFCSLRKLSYMLWQFILTVLLPVDVLINSTLQNGKQDQVEKKEKAKLLLQGRSMWVPGEFKH